MYSEARFMPAHPWQDPRASHSSWSHNGVFLDPQMFAPGDYRAHNHYSSECYRSRERVAMATYTAQFSQPVIWNSWTQVHPHHGQISGDGRIMPQSLPRHGRSVPQQYFANVGSGCSVSPHRQSMSTPQINQYGYGHFQRASSNFGSGQAMVNGSVGVGASCHRCSSSMPPPSQTVRPAEVPPTPASPSLARGPPRKPKRSGHAVWVGNVPRGASIEALKDHFSHQATKDIESVFLMAQSNCAFVNYDTEEACVSAVERFNYSLFGSVRLLCRMRREPASQRETSSCSGTSSHSDSPVRSVREEMPSLQASSSFENIATDLNGLGIQPDGGNKTDTVTGEEAAKLLSPPARPPDRYFIIKSLTQDDVQNSIMTGTWETQPHNQRGFDDAFLEAQNVYMIFSVNKSGEYFGYARMISSPLTQSSSPQGTVSASISPGQHSDTLKITRTAATATAPAGVVIDDTTRGTLFWEAQHEDNGVVSSTLTALDRAELDGHIRSRPFRVEWLSVRRVPFRRTKGIRNLWNNNKEVKVARDGTELETNVGRKIVALFHESHEDITKRA